MKVEWIDARCGRKVLWMGGGTTMTKEDHSAPADGRGRVGVRLAAPHRREPPDAPSPCTVRGVCVYVFACVHVWVCGCLRACVLTLFKIHPKCRTHVVVCCAR